MSNNQNKTYQPKDKEPVKSVDSDYIEVIKCEGKPLVDVVENKETVEEAALIEYPIQYDMTDEVAKFYNDKRIDLNYDARLAFITGANWQQSQSIEGIVGFVLEAAKYAYDYHANSQFPEMSFEDNCKNNLLQWMQGKGYTDSTQHNHASFVALVEGRLSEINIEIEKTDPHNYDRHNELCSVYDELTDLLNKIKL